jgi:hypothetical protein
VKGNNKNKDRKKERQKGKCSVFLLTDPDEFSASNRREIYTYKWG